MARNHAIVIGYLGGKRVYVNVSRTEAIERFCSTESLSVEDIEKDQIISEFDFDDEFYAYDAWR